MKLSFSTVGCPNWLWGEILSAAKDLHYQGIELRGIGENLFLPEVRMFKPENIEKTRNDLKKSGIEVACISSDCFLHRQDADYVGMAREYITLARDLGAKNVRVLGDTWVEPGKDADDALVLSRLIKLAPAALENGVTLLLETNGVFSETGRLRELIEAVNSPAVRVLWDVNHPVRNFGESVDKTWENIGRYVSHVHLKDSVMENGSQHYKMLGYGTLPVAEAFKKLKNSGYDGYLSLEWTKRWNEELEDAGIVFSHFAYMAKKMWEDA